jgi:hypothetical protein
MNSSIIYLKAYNCIICVYADLFTIKIGIQRKDFKIMDTNYGYIVIVLIIPIAILCPLIILIKPARKLLKWLIKR